MSKCLLVSVFAVQLLAIGLTLKVDLKILNKHYLPFTYTPSVQFQLEGDAAEQMAYDVETKLLYSVGHNNIHVINISDVNSIKVLWRSSMDNVDITDVEVCGGYVFVAVDNQTEREVGFVNVYRGFDASNNRLELVHKIMVGDLPDMLHPTHDCSKLVVALEAEPYDDSSSSMLVDNPGGVVIVTFQGTPADTYTMTTLDFSAYNDKIEELEKSGVRQIYKGNNNTFANDVEPEYIAFNQEETKAYISLQENNAIAVVDMATETIEGVFGLGYKDWSNLQIDVSNKDGGIHLRPWSILGMYQPDSIKVYRHQGVDYVITANEGDSKDYTYFSEEVRVADVGLSEMFESNATVRATLEQEENLGRLKVTNVNGVNATTGKFDRLYSYGGRSFSIWRASDMAQVYDSGSELGTKAALLHPNLFNNHLGGFHQTLVAASMDDRSDDKGLETESLELGTVGNHTLLFVGNERPGLVAVYTIDRRNPDVRPVFHTLLADIPRTDHTWIDLYEQRRLSMIDCEDMRFIPADVSPNGHNLLLVSGSVSGTITIVQVDVVDEEEGGDTGESNIIAANFAGVLLLSLVTVISNMLIRG